MHELPDSDLLERWETNPGSTGTQEIYLHPTETARTLIRRLIGSVLFLLVGSCGWWYFPAGLITWGAWLDIALGVLILLNCARIWLWGMQARLVTTIDERGITDHHWPRYPLFIPREEIEAVILFRQSWRLWIGVRVRAPGALLGTLPGWVAWCRRRGLPESISFAVSDARLSWSIRKMAEEISARYGVPIGCGPGIGGDRSPEG